MKLLANDRDQYIDGTAHAMTQAHGIEFVGIGTQSGLDIAQTFAPDQLRECQHPKLFGAGHAAHPGIARVAIGYAGKTRSRNKMHDLCEQRLANILTGHCDEG